MIYASFFARIVLFASFEKASGANHCRGIVPWIAAGLVTSFVVGLPSLFSDVVSTIARRDRFL